MSDLPTMGRVLAFDHGSTRIGVAVSDPLRITAGPREVIPADDAMTHVRRLVEEFTPVVIVVGLPVGLSGREGSAAESARAFGNAVAADTGLPVVYIDERFTTRTAEDALLEGGVKRRDRRNNVDKVAAAVILQQFLEKSRLTAQPRTDRSTRPIEGDSDDDRGPDPHHSR